MLESHDIAELELLIDQTKISVLNIQRHVPSLKKWVCKWVWYILILRKLKSQGKRKSGWSHGVCAGKSLRNWTKTTA